MSPIIAPHKGRKVQYGFELFFKKMIHSPIKRRICKMVLGALPRIVDVFAFFSQHFFMDLFYL